MNVKQLIAILKKGDQNATVVIPVSGEVGIGGSRCEEVSSANYGFDWDSGRLFIRPKQSLFQRAPATTDLIATMAAIIAAGGLARGKGWEDSFIPARVEVIDVVYELLDEIQKRNIAEPELEKPTKKKKAKK